MKRPRAPEFLARQSYRMRRLMDAARLLPVFGLVLLLLPLMRPSPVGEAPPTAMEGVYLFSVWGALIAVAVLLSMVLRRALEAPGSAEGNQPESRPPESRLPRALASDPPARDAQVLDTARPDAATPDTRPSGRSAPPVG